MKSNGIKYLSFILFVLPLFAQENPCIQGPTYNIDKCREFLAKGLAEKSAQNKAARSFESFRKIFAAWGVLFRRMFFWNNDFFQDSAGYAFILNK